MKYPHDEILCRTLLNDGRPCGKRAFLIAGKSEDLARWPWHYYCMWCQIQGRPYLTRAEAPLHTARCIAFLGLGCACFEQEPPPEVI